MLFMTLIKGKCVLFSTALKYVSINYIMVFTLCMIFAWLKINIGWHTIKKKYTLKQLYHIQAALKMRMCTSNSNLPEIHLSWTKNKNLNKLYSSCRWNFAPSVCGTC